MNFVSGFPSTKSLLANGHSSYLAFVKLATKSSISIKGVGKTRATLISGEGDLLAYPNGNNLVAESTGADDQLVGIELQPDAIAFGALAADTAPTTFGFSSDDDEFDLDSPTEGFSSIPEAIEDIRQGKVSCFSSLKCDL